MTSDMRSPLPWIVRHRRGMVACSKYGITSGGVTSEAYVDSYEVVMKIHLNGNQWGAVVGPDPIGGVTGFGYSE